MIDSRSLGQGQLKMAMSLQTGTIIRANPVGLAHSEDIKSKEIYSFTFDKIEGYRGQSVEELGLISGSRVAFSSLDGVVRSVRIRHTLAIPATAHVR